MSLPGSRTQRWCWPERLQTATTAGYIGFVTERIPITEKDDSLKIIDERIKETTKLAKESTKKLDDYIFPDFINGSNSSQFSSVIEEQKQINRNIIENMEHISSKIYLIQNSVIGDPNNLGQVGTILARLTELERNVLPDSTQWPRLPVLNGNPITTQEENISSILLALLYQIDPMRITPSKKIPTDKFRSGTIALHPKCRIRLIKPHTSCSRKLKN